MRFSGKFALKVGAVGVAAGAILAPMTAANAAPTLTITPNTGVNSGDKVSVSGSGFSPTATSITLTECGSATPVAADCDTTTTTGTALAGALSPTMVTVHTGAVGDKTCAAGGTCYIQASDGTNTVVGSFTFAAAAAGPTITVTPATGVKSGDKVSVSGSGFPTTATSINLVECGSATPVQADCDTTTFVNVPITAGAFTGAMVTVHTGAVGDKTCAAGGTCYIAGSTVTSGGDATNSAVGSFTFAAAATGPTVTVTPATGVKDGDTVSVSGTGFPVSTAVQALECGTGATTLADCDPATVKGGTTDATGAFTGVMVTVHTGAVGDKTCNAGGTCAIVASTAASPADETPTNTGIGSFTFAPAGGTGASITLNPTKNVKDGGSITVTGTGFPAKAEPAYVVECGLQAGTQGSNCDTDNVGFANTKADGTLSFTLTGVHTGKLGTDGSCKAGGKCAISVTTDTSGKDPNQSATATFTFASGGGSGKPAVTKTKAKFSNKKDEILGSVTSKGSGVKGVKTKLEIKKGSHWKVVGHGKTHGGGAFVFKHVTTSGTYEVKALKNHKFKGSTSNKIKV